MMEKRQIFLAAWREKYGSEEPPDLDFLESNDEHLFWERLNSCKSKVEESISLLKREGFLLKWMIDTYNVQICKDEENFLLFAKVMRVLLDHCTKRADELHPVDKTTQTLYLMADDCEDDLKERKELFLNKTLDCFNLTANKNEMKSLDKSHECVDETNGSQSVGVANVRLNENNLGAAVEIQFELFNKTNTESGNKGGSHILLEQREKSDGVTNDKDSKKEEVCDENVCSESLESSLASSSSSVEDMAEDFESSLVGDKTNKESPLSKKDLNEASSLSDRPFSTVFAPFSTQFHIEKDGKKSKTKRHIPKITYTRVKKHLRSHTHDGGTESTPEKLIKSAKSERNVSDSELDQFGKWRTGECFGHDGGSQNIILTTNASSTNSMEKERVAVVNEPVNITVCIDGDIPVNVLGSNPQVVSSEAVSDTPEETDEANEATPVTPDPIEVIGDLMSYLNAVEVISSDEDDTSQDIIALAGLPAPKGTRKKLGSALSTMSVQSGDSCMSPWAIDVAVAEMGDSSECEDTHSGDSAAPGEGKSMESLSSLADAICTEFDNDEPLPIRPPRRNKNDRRSLRTVTFEAKKSHIGDDEVFKSADDGYEGDQEGVSFRHEKVARRFHGPSVEYRKDYSARRSQSDASDLVSRSNRDDERQRKMRKARVAQVILDSDNVDFPSSPLSPTFEDRAKELDEDDTEKLQTRKWVVSGVLDSEKGYVECLELLRKYMKPLRLTIGTASQVLTMADFNKIFFKIEELHSIHSRFYNELEARVSYWNSKKIIGDLFITLVDQFGVYGDYILNYKIAFETIHKCKSNEQFNSIFTKEVRINSLQECTTLEALFSKPVERVGRYIVVLSDLIKHTPEDHPDYMLLVETLKLTKEFLSRISGDHRDGSLSFTDGAPELKAVHQPFHRVKKDHRLIKDNFVVELSDGVRKFRHLFLFNDVLLCTKRKFSGRHETYVCKWHVPVSDLSFKPMEASEAPQTVPVTSQDNLDLLRSRIASLRADIRREQGMQTHHGSSPESSPGSRRKRTLSSSKPSNLNKSIERLQRKLAEQEVNLLLAIPSLPLTLYTRQGKTYTLLFKSDIDRADWKDAITPLLQQSNVSECGSLSPFELHAMLEVCKKLRTVQTLGGIPIKEDKEVLNGLLYVYIRSGRGFHRNDLYCVLEVDHYGQFIRKAKTTSCKATTDPVWDQDFDIEIEGTHYLKVLVYYKSILRVEELCGQATIDLKKEGVRDKKKKDFTLTLDKQGAVSLTIQFNSHSSGIQRKRSRSVKGVFGVDIARVCKREMSDIPLVVIGCVREIEKRGLDEVGIYRLSGATTDVRKLRQAFEENSQSAIVMVAEMDIHAVAGLLKMYLRDLPEPLLTDYLYPYFLEANVIKDPQEKSRRMFELFDKLPKPNRMTTLYLIEHLRKVAEFHETNKMTLNNLATVFGPNILRPTTKSNVNPENAVTLALGTLNVMSQVGIFLYFLKSDSVLLRLPEDPILLSRLDPARSSQRSLGPDWSDQQDRLI